MAAQSKNQSEITPNQTNQTEKVLLSWQAPSRPFKRRSRDFYVTLVAMSSMVGLVIFLIEGFMPILLLISLVFLFYVLSTVEPEIIEYQITNWGIKIASKTTDWQMMNRYWFTNRFGSTLLVIETFKLPGRMEVVVDPGSVDKINDILKKRLTHEEIPPSNLDRATAWFSKFLPD